MMRAVVLSFDSLSADLLGYYGNEIVSTGNFDRCAARSTVFDQHYGENFAESPRSHSWWTGRYTFPLETSQQQPRSTLFERLQQHGVVTRLLHVPGGHVPLPSSHNQDDEESESATGRVGVHSTFESLVQNGIEFIDAQIKNATPRWMLWLKARGVHTDDAPSENTNRPGPADAAEAIYSEVERIDEVFGKLWSRVSELAVDGPVLFMLTADRPCFVGNTAEGATANSAIIHQDVARTPLLIASFQGDSVGSRRQSLVQTIDVAPTLLEWFEIGADKTAQHGQSLLPEISEVRELNRDSIFFGSRNVFSGIRTASFLLIRSEAENGPKSSALYEKPEDRWNVHDVAQQFPDVAAELAARLDRSFTASGSGE